MIDPAFYIIYITRLTFGPDSYSISHWQVISIGFENGLISVFVNLLLYVGILVIHALLW